MPDNADVVIESNAPATSPPPEPAEEAGRSARVSQAMNDLLRSGRGRGRSASPPSDAASETETPTEEKDAATATEEAKPAEETFTLTKAELDRRIQAETDRRETVRKQREAREARKQKLRDDPLGASHEVLQELEHEEATQSDAARILQATQGIVETYDEIGLSRMFRELPGDTQAKLLSDHAHLQGFEQRGALFTAAIAQIQKLARAQGAKDAEAKLRSNPAFQKQALTTLRDERDEPETVAAARPQRPVDMNSLILGATRRR